jgi:hypothetical protein
VPGYDLFGSGKHLLLALALIELFIRSRTVTSISLEGLEILNESLRSANEPDDNRERGV